MFGYDGHGRRSFRTLGGNRTELWYDTTGLTLESGYNNVTYLRDGDGTLLSRSGGAGYYTYGRDRLGSTTALVTTGQSVANSYSYDPWGETIGLTGTAYNPFLFTGVYKDGATGLYSMTQRYYQPSTGRFTQLDPLPKNLISVNRYAYAGCNPTNFVDPSGLDACEPAALLAASGYVTFAGTFAAFIVTIVTGGTFTAVALAGTFFYGATLGAAGADHYFFDTCYGGY